MTTLFAALNAVEGFLSIITRPRLKRGVFTSVSHLKDAIARYVREHDKTSSLLSGP